MNLSQISQPFLKQFPGDFSGNPMQRQTPGFLFATVDLAEFKNPELLIFNEKLSEEIGLGSIEDEKDDLYTVLNILQEKFPKNKNLFQL